MQEEAVLDVSDLACSASLVLLVKRIADSLERHYPGWAWAVQPDERGGVINIFSMRLSGEWGYRLLIKDVQGDPKVCDPKFIRAGGEILERFGVRRRGYTYEAWKETEKDIGGVARADISDQAAKFRRHQRDKALDSALRRGIAELKVVDTPTATGIHREISIRAGGSDGRKR